MHVRSLLCYLYLLAGNKCNEIVESNLDVYFVKIIFVIYIYIYLYKDVANYDCGNIFGTKINENVGGGGGA